MSSSKRAKPAPAPDPRELLTAWVAPESGRPELWVVAAWVVFGVFVAEILVLGARPGGVLPVWIFVEGRLLVGLAALVVLIIGLVRALRRPPFLRRRRLTAIVALVLVLGVANAPFPYPSSYERNPSALAFRLPVEAPAPGEAWRVVWGGPDPDHNRLADFYPDRRYGMHLVLERDGRSGSGDRATDHFAFGRTVVAPAAGRVVGVHDGEHDREAPGRGPASEPFGNYVAIEVAPDEVLFLTNLRKGSLRVREGEEVAAGQALAEVGWSGAPGPTTLEPHVAVHLADDRRPCRGEGIPLRFHDYFTASLTGSFPGHASGEQHVESGVPRGGLGPGGERLGELIRPADR